LVRPSIETADLETADLETADMGTADTLTLRFDPGLERPTFD
jgi:hypothetical protein